VTAQQPRTQPSLATSMTSHTEQRPQKRVPASEPAFRA
jgi:hypothetical protein